MCAVTRMIDFSFYPNGKVFDLINRTDRTAPLFITDYSRLDREIIIDKTARSENLGGQQQHTEINSIEGLKTTFEQLIPSVLKVLTNRNIGIEVLGSISIFENVEELTLFSEPIINTFDFGIGDEEKNLLVNQLVFDILFDKYLNESELMSRNAYSKYMAEKLYSDPIQRMDCTRAINENLTRGMKTHYNMMKYSALRDQLEMLGVDPDKYDEYYNPNLRKNPRREKPKFIWDYFYYNYGRNLKEPTSDDDTDRNPKYGRGMITSKQYQRQLTRESRNYSYQEFFEDLKKYHEFVNKLLPVENESWEKYFRMSMDYYVLESYKRIDFMVKIIDSLPQTKIDKIDKDYFLVKRFHPLVSVPYEESDKLCFTEKHKYYRPLFIMENELLKELQRDDTYDYGKYGIRLQKYQFIRAKAYELFKYHCKFISTDYIEIKEFLRQNQDMRAYHQSNDFWQFIQNTEWKDMDKEQQDQIKVLLQNIILLNNDAFFWKSPDREYTKPKKE